MSRNISPSAGKPGRKRVEKRGSKRPEKRPAFMDRERRMGVRSSTGTTFGAKRQKKRMAGRTSTSAAGFKNVGSSAVSYKIRAGNASKLLAMFKKKR